MTFLEFASQHPIVAVTFAMVSVISIAENVRKAFAPTPPEDA